MASELSPCYKELPPPQVPTPRLDLEKVVEFFRILLEWEQRRDRIERSTTHDETPGPSAERPDASAHICEGVVERPGTGGVFDSSPAETAPRVRPRTRLTIVREFVDVETAKQAGRGGFGEMLAFLKADAVLPHDPRREDRPALPQHQGLDDRR